MAETIRTFVYRQACLNATSRELHANGGLGLEAELIPRETGEQVGLADSRVTNQHHLEEVVIAGNRGGRQEVGWGSEQVLAAPWPSQPRSGA
jgi:hypothetical protein